MDNKKLLGKRIKETRKSLGYTQEKLAEIVGLDITTLSGIESGRHFPSLANLEKIANLLNVSLYKLFDYNNYISASDMRKVISENIDMMSDEDVKFVFKFLDKKYLNN